MATLDNCARADETPLSNGGQWGGDMFGRANHRLGLVGGRIVDADEPLGNSGGAYWLASPTSADQSVWITAEGTPPTLGWYEVFARMVGVGGGSVNGYGLFIDGNGSLTVYRMDAGAQTSLFSLGSWVAGDKLELRCTGTTIASYKNNVLVGSVTDATYGANGKIGLLLSPNTTTSVSSFGGDTFSAPPAANPGFLALMRS